MTEFRTYVIISLVDFYRWCLIKCFSNCLSSFLLGNSRAPYSIGKCHDQAFSFVAVTTADISIITFFFFFLQLHYLVTENRQREIVDLHCEGVQPESLDALLSVAIQCVSSGPEDRPTMHRVVQILESVMTPCPSDFSYDSSWFKPRGGDEFFWSLPLLPRK